jgi:hypothetical protein
VRGIALWIALLGLSYLAAGLAMVFLLQHAPAENDSPWFPLPGGMSAADLLKGALFISGTALFSSVQLFRLKKSGRVLCSLFLLAAAGWSLWKSYLYGADVMPILTAGINLWFTSLLWRADADAVFNGHEAPAL